jgi:hypothetical protein
LAYEAIVCRCKELHDLIGETVSLKERRLLACEWPDLGTVHTMFMKELYRQIKSNLRYDVMQKNYFK